MFVWSMFGLKLTVAHDSLIFDGNGHKMPCLWGSWSWWPAIDLRKSPFVDCLPCLESWRGRKMEDWGQVKHDPNVEAQTTDAADDDDDDDDSKHCWFLPLLGQSFSFFSEFLMLMEKEKERLKLKTASAIAAIAIAAIPNDFPVGHSHPFCWWNPIKQKKHHNICHDIKSHLKKKKRKQYNSKMKLRCLPKSTSS